MEKDKELEISFPTSWERVFLRGGKFLSYLLASEGHFVTNAAINLGIEKTFPKLSITERECVRYLLSPLLKINKFDELVKTFSYAISGHYPFGFPGSNKIYPLEIGENFFQDCYSDCIVLFAWETFNKIKNKKYINFLSKIILGNGSQSIFIFKFPKKYKNLVIFRSKGFGLKKYDLDRLKIISNPNLLISNFDLLNLGFRVKISGTRALMNRNLKACSDYRLTFPVKVSLKPVSQSVKKYNLALIDYRKSQTTAWPCTTEKKLQFLKSKKTINYLYCPNCHKEGFYVLQLSKKICFKCFYKELSKGKEIPKIF